MTAIRCAAARRRIQAFHDGELPVSERLEVAGHLEHCPLCADEARGLARLGDALREDAQQLASDLPDENALQSAILGRLQAEREVSLPVRMGRLFEDMHLVWAGLSATAATATCAALVFGLWFFSPRERDDSLAGVLSALASPGSDRNPVALDPRMRLPRVSEAAGPAIFEPSADEEDLVFALAAVVTQEGRIARSEVLVSNHRDRDLLVLMNAIRDARFQPASLRGNPVAVNLVWLVTHTTVRGKIHS